MLVPFTIKKTHLYNIFLQFTNFTKVKITIHNIIVRHFQIINLHNTKYYKIYYLKIQNKIQYDAVNDIT